MTNKMTGKRRGNDGGCLTAEEYFGEVRVHLIQSNLTLPNIPNIPNFI